MKGHKYLNDIGIKKEDTPWGWNKTDKRQKQWKEEREIYGLDERETWSLDVTFYFWLYERLMKYKECSFIDGYRKYIIDGKELTQQECIDKMLIGCKSYFKLTKGCASVVDDEKARDIGREIIETWKECIFSMWW